MTDNIIVLEEYLASPKNHYRLLYQDLLKLEIAFMVSRYDEDQSYLINPEAIRDLHFLESEMTFLASFTGKSTRIRIPYNMIDHFGEV